MAVSGELTGFTVGITADRRWTEQAALFERRGATVIRGPAIRTLPLGTEPPLRRATEEVLARPPAVLIANTGVGIRSWFASAEAWGLGQALAATLSRTRIYARGPKAAAAVHSAGLEVTARARSEQLSEIIDLVIDGACSEERVAVQLDGSGGSDQIDRLLRAGIDVVPIPVYRWGLPDDMSPALRLAEAVIAGRVQAVTFTSGPVIRNWFCIAERQGMAAELRRALTDGRTVVGSIGPVCTRIALSEGLGSDHLVQPEAYRLGPLVRTVTERLMRRRVTIEVATATMTISGNAVLVDGELLSLSSIENRLLSTLAARPNTVFTKEQLLRAVWDGTTSDAHTVEVGIARLRKRLGPHASAILSVYRRGYTLRTCPSDTACDPRPAGVT